ncbi:unnamed protein product [Owenia fusiformis]|uniref:Uncharacterized protein n=1 Tax=Owenia fusiformis TaxID=6347 RepID=A0A8J1U739_OWEFU|nr:unnamed protein product [Owenia fusiformis]
MNRLHHIWMICYICSELFCVTGFNIDLQRPVIHEGPQRDSYFGYSVAQHIDGNYNWLLIGAPLTQTGQSGISKGGAVLRCSIHTKNDCQEIPFDLKGNNIEYIDQSYIEIDDKSNQWFGATVTSSGKNGKIVACAPKYIRYLYAGGIFREREPIGTCFTTTSSMTSMNEYSPCRNNNHGYWRQGSCQAGLAAIISQDESRLIIGAVGSFYWQGQVISQSLFLSGDIIETPERDPSEDNTYMGYSIATGQFTGNNAKEYVAGIPRGGKLKGEIVIFDQDLDRLTNITGDQIGSYFGAALAVSDFNGDNLDDIAIGAPLYTEEFGQKEEMGCVYVYYQTSTNQMNAENRDTLVGLRSKSRFGTSVAAIKDINNDNFKDLAIGAPYGGNDGNGAVYFYHGSSKGIQTQYSQVVYAADIDSGIKTFGWSIAGGYDMDGNSYPDVLVGAYASSHAVLLKSRPIIRISTDINIEPGMINLDNRPCILSNGRSVTCIAIKTCLTYDGLEVPQYIEINVEWTLDPESVISPRMFFLQSGSQHKESQMVRLFKSEKWCDTMNAYIKNNIRDKITPLSVDVRHNLKEDVYIQRGKLIPIIEDMEKTHRGSAKILTNCGDDDICQPDLSVNIKGSTQQHILDDNTPIRIHIAVENKGENAFEAQLTLQLPSGTKYIRTSDVSSTRPISCTNVNENLVSCDIGNPLPSYQKVSLVVTVAPSNINDNVDVLRFTVKANSSNTENSTVLADNTHYLDIPLTVSAKITLNGVSKPEQFLYNASQITNLNKTTDTEIGPEVIHLYEVRNLGPSSIAAAEVEILWPSQFENGDNLFYLTEIPQIIRGSGSCTTDMVNPDNIILLPHGEVESSNQLTDDLHSYTRRRRDVDHGSVNRMQCTSNWCTLIICDVHDMKNDDIALIEIRSRLWLDSFTKKRQQSMVIVSEALAQVVKMPYKIKPMEYSLDIIQVSTYVGTLNEKPKPKTVEIWIIIVAVIVGILLLVLLVIFFWKCGFFKRKKYNDQDAMIPEKEKMNPNAEHEYD